MSSNQIGSSLDDDSLESQEYNDLDEVSPDAVNRPDQIVWSETWDLEDGFRYHIRSGDKPNNKPS